MKLRLFHILIILFCLCGGLVMTYALFRPEGELAHPEYQSSTVSTVTGSDASEHAHTGTSVERKKESIRMFMMTKYGLNEDELKGLDLIRLMDDYDFQDMDYTADEIREILMDQGEYYQDTGYTDIFYFLDAEEGNKLSRGTEIQRIGFLYNEGTLNRKIVYDLKNGKYYNDSPNGISMTDAQVKTLHALPETYGIFEWDLYYGGTEAHTTGSLGWKIVFECSDGQICSYGGYTQDMTHLPDKFEDVVRVLFSIAGDDF